MREKRHVGNLQGAEQLNRRHQPEPAGAPATLTAAARGTPHAGFQPQALLSF